MRPRFPLLVLAFVLGAPPACGGAADRREPVTLRVGEVTDRTRNSDLRHAPTLVRALVAREIERSTAFRQSDDGGSELDIWLARMDGQGGPEVLALHLRVELPEAGDNVPDQLAATVEVRREGGGERERADDLELAVRRAVTVLEAKLVLSRGDAGAIRRLLSSSDPDLLVLALEEIRDGKRGEFAEAVVPLLEHEDDSVVRAAIECLGEVGSAQHVPRLIRATKLGDESYANRLYEALASLGGQQAYGFLQFAVRNEEDPSLAAAAQRALERVEAGGRLPPSSPEPRMTRGHR